MADVGGKRRWLPPSKRLIYMVKSYLAEEVGFEPTERVNVRRFSRPVHSTTLPLLRHFVS
jgi:hypothetical protein